MAILDFIRKTRKPKSSSVERSQVVHDCTAISDIPKYPPYNPGLPAVSPKQIVDSQQELIDRLKRTVPASHLDFDKTYMRAIEAYASFVHLLPASESHHHRGTGGLFRHGLEAGLYGAMNASRLMFVLDEVPSKRRVLEPIWRFAAFLAALSHDIGKPISDVEVTNTSGDLTWKPLTCTLHQWATKNNISHYHIRFCPGRYNYHEKLGVLAIGEIIDSELIDIITDGGPKLLVLLLDAIANREHDADSVNPFYDLVKNADQDSVNRDLKTNRALQSNMPSVGIAAERFVIDAMRRLLRDKTWKVNCRGAQVWVIDDNMFISWTAARHIVQIINKDNVPGVPRDPHTIAEMLVERDLAVARETFQGRRLFWRIAPDELGGTILNTVKMSSPTLLLDPPPGNTSGRIFNDDEEIESEEPIQKKEDSSEKEPEAEVSEKETTPLKKDANEDISDKKQQQPVKKETVQEEVKKPAQEAPTIQAPKQSSPLSDNPVLQEIISVLAEEICNGKRDSSQIRRESGMVVMAWPDAFAGYGQEPNEVLKEFTDAKIVVPDPALPTRFVRDSKDKGKVVVITTQAGNEILKSVAMANAGTKTNKSNPEKSTPQPQPQNSDSENDIVGKLIRFCLNAKPDYPFTPLEKKNGVSVPYRLAIPYFVSKAGLTLKVVEKAINKELSEDNPRIHKGTIRTSLRLTILNAKL